MPDVFIDAPAIGQRLQKSAKTGRRIMESSGLPQFIIGGKRYVREDHFDAWTESQRIDRPIQPQPSSLKTMLEQIGAKALAGRKGAA